MMEPMPEEIDAFHRDPRVWFMSWLLVRGFKDMGAVLRHASREFSSELARDDALREIAERFDGWAATARRLREKP